MHASKCLNSILKGLLLCFIVMQTSLSLAQDNPLNPDAVYLRDLSKGRKILGQFTFSLSTGYQWNMYSIEPMDYLMTDYADEALLGIGQWPSGNVNRAFSHWLTNPQGPVNLNRDQLQQVFGGDSLANKWRGVGQSVPVHLTVHYILAERVRLGLGIHQEFGQSPEQVRRLGATSGASRVDYPSSTVNFRRIFLYLGAKIMDYKRYSLSADVQVGNSRYRGDFDTTAVGSNTINLGLAMEYNFSIYSASFIRAGVESRSYTLNKANLPVPLEVNNPVYGITFGLRFRIPDVKRCPISSCQVRYMHGHNGFEFRGSSIFRKQNLKYGEGYGKKDVRRN